MRKKNKYFLEIANIYAKMIEHVEGETLSETRKRLSVAVGERIQPTVFNMAVNMVRQRNPYNGWLSVNLLIIILVLALLLVAFFPL